MRPVAQLEWGLEGTVDSLRIGEGAFHGYRALKEGNYGMGLLGFGTDFLRGIAIWGGAGSALKKGVQGVGLAVKVAGNRKVQKSLLDFEKELLKKGPAHTVAKESGKSLKKKAERLGSINKSKENLKGSGVKGGEKTIDEMKEGMIHRITRMDSGGVVKGVKGLRGMKGWGELWKKHGNKLFELMKEEGSLYGKCFKVADSYTDAAFDFLKNKGFKVREIPLKKDPGTTGALEIFRNNKWERVVERKKIKIPKLSGTSNWKGNSNFQIHVALEYLADDGRRMIFDPTLADNLKEVLKRHIVPKRKTPWIKDIKPQKTPGKVTGNPYLDIENEKNTLAFLERQFLFTPEEHTKIIKKAFEISKGMRKKR